MLPKIGIIYLSFHCEPYLRDVIESLKCLTYPRELIEFIIVDNPHPEHGSSVPYIEKCVLPLSGKEIPPVTVLPQATNVGFPAGNNAGIAWALLHGCEYVLFHNNDGYFAPNAIEPLIDVLTNDRTIGAVQSLVMLHPETSLVNSAGNLFHYLGFGFSGGYRHTPGELALPPLRDVSYASGAAVCLRADLLRRYGSWDADFFLYHEDCEYSFRLRMLGYRVVLARDSLFYHKYKFKRSIANYYWMERNRYGMMLIFFRWPTLLLLLPMALALEPALMIFAWRGGWLRTRLQVYWYWMQPKHWHVWLAKRRKIQVSRTIRDRDLLLNAAAGIYFQEKEMETPWLTRLGNPIMRLYYWIIVRGLIWW